MLALMIDLDHDEESLSEWSVADEAEEEDCDSNNVCGENAIDRFACALGGKTILPHIMATIPPMLQNRKNLTLTFEVHFVLGTCLVYQ